MLSKHLLNKWNNTLMLGFLWIAKLIYFKRKPDQLSQCAIKFLLLISFISPPGQHYLHNYLLKWLKWEFQEENKYLNARNISRYLHTPHLILSIILRNRCPVHFTDIETEAEVGQHMTYYSKTIDRNNNNSNAGLYDYKVQDH